MTITFTPASAQATPQTAGGTVTFNTITLASTPAASDLVILGLFATNGSVTPYFNITINGNIIGGSSAAIAGGGTASIYSITGNLVNTTTPIVSLQFSGSGGNINPLMGVISGLAGNNTPTFTAGRGFTSGGDPQSLTVGPISSNGIGLFFDALFFAGSFNTPVNCSIDSTNTGSSSAFMVGHSTTPTGSWVPQVNDGGSGDCLVGVTWAGPAVGGLTLASQGTVVMRDRLKELIKPVRKLWVPGKRFEPAFEM